MAGFLRAAGRCPLLAHPRVFNGVGLEKPKWYECAVCAISVRLSLSAASSKRCATLCRHATGGMCGLCVSGSTSSRHATQLRILLLIAGIEPNPGPVWKDLPKETLEAVLRYLHAEEEGYSPPNTLTAMRSELQATDPLHSNLAYELVKTAAELEAGPSVPPTVPLPLSDSGPRLIVLPPFSPDIARTWFEQAEAILATSSPQNQQLSLVRALPTEVIQQAGAVLSGSFDDIKSCVLKYYDVSDDHRLRRLLDEKYLGDRKPSVALRHLQSLAPGNDDLIRLRFLEMLPERVRLMMATLGDASVSTMAEVADKAMELVSDRPGSSGVHAIADGSLTSDVPAMLCAITERLDRLETRAPGPGAPVCRDQSTCGKQSVRSSAGRHNSRPARRDVSSNISRAGLCFYHSRFGSRARKCHAGCQWNKWTHQQRKEHDGNRSSNSDAPGTSRRSPERQ